MSPEFASLLGGSALLFYSIEELSKNVQLMAGSKFRMWINDLAQNRFTSVILGMALAILLSSSGAVTAMLVGLATARLLSLEQAFAVTLGASLGSTFILHLFAFQIANYEYLLLAGGVMLTFFSRTDRFFHLGRSLLFLGLLFLSMSIIRDTGSRLEQNELFQYTINYFRARPLMSLFISTVLTAIIPSSTATIAFVMSLVTARNGAVIEAIPWVLGANLGTTATAYFAGLRAGAVGKQVAFAHLLCKFVGVVLLFPLMTQLAHFVEEMTPNDVSRQIAYTHTLFNLILVMLFLPFVKLGVKLVRRLIPEREGDGTFSLLYLDSRALSTPELALAQAQREILRLSDVVEKMVEKSIELFHHGDYRQIEALKAMDQGVDFLNRGIKLYLTKLSQNEMTPHQVHKEFELLLRTNDLENIGDTVDKNILELARKNLKKGYTFSREGWDEITIFHTKVVECLRISTAYFNSRDPGLQSKLLTLHQEIDDLMLDLTEQHVQRLHRGVKETLSTTSVHLDLLGNLKRVADLAINFTKVKTNQAA